MTKDEIKQAALECGFKLKQQPDGTMDLNPYVYDFADKIAAKHLYINAKLLKRMKEGSKP